MVEQREVINTVEVPQIQYIDRVVDILVVHANVFLEAFRTSRFICTLSPSPISVGRLNMNTSVAFMVDGDESRVRLGDRQCFG